MESKLHLAMSAEQVLDREFLEIRAKILEIAASLDRLDRAEGDVAADPRTERLQAGLQKLLDPSPDRAEQVQQVFSRSYDSQWRDTFQLPPR